MKLKIRGLLAAVAALFLLSGCAGQAEPYEWTAAENSLYITGEGQVQSALVYTAAAPNELYTQEGLADFARAAVAAYNEVERGSTAREADPVTLVDCRLSGETGTLVFSYASAGDFVDFSAAADDNTHSVTALTVGPVSEQNLPETAFYGTNGKEVSRGKAAAKREAVCVLTEGTATVCTEGKILYVSEGVVLRDGHCALTPAGTGCIIFK